MEITWDETDHERITVLNRKFKKEELLDMDFQAYLASSSEDEEEKQEELEGIVNLLVTINGHRSLAVALQGRPNSVCKYAHMHSIIYTCR